MTGLDYCKLADVLAIVYAGQGLAPGEAAPSDDTRDARLTQLITVTSRDFDFQVTENDSLPGLFAPQYDSRLYSGKGSQVLEVDPFLAVVKLELLTNPGQPISSQTWVDYTSEIAAGRIGLLPLRGYPKSSIFRQSSFYVDPFPLGNVRLGAVYGNCIVDPSAQEPTPQTPGFAGFTQAQIDAMSPTGASGGGWYVTPDDVREAVATWVVYRFEAGKAAFSDQPATPAISGTTVKYPKTIPDDVQRVIERYKGDIKMPNFALVPWGSEDPEDGSRGYRWAGWQTSGPSN